MIGSGIHKVSVDQDVDIGQQHLQSGMPGSEPKLVFNDVKRARPVEVNTATRSAATNCDKPKRRLARRLAALERIVQRPGDEGAHAQALFSSFAAYLRGKLVIKRNCRSHYAQHNIDASVHNATTFCRCKAVWAYRYWRPLMTDPCNPEHSRCHPKRSRGFSYSRFPGDADSRERGCSDAVLRSVGR